ncbi:MAG: VOC family protein [Defluviitaleaceae bacterium]|nr:VOC family protein [Defluviitaleaceae bacterium]
MKIRPYLTFDGQCNEAIELYKRAFNTDTLECMLFGQMPPIPGFEVPEEYKVRVLQATMKFGDDFIRLSDCGYAPGFKLNEQESERISLAVETGVDEIKHAFNILSEEGHVGIPLEETFYSPCAGVVFDKFGVMWNLVANK